MPSEDEQSLINVNLPLKILHIRVIDWALTHNFASFLDIDRAAAKHLERMDQVVYSAARLNLSVTRV
ncbi:MAG: hypothetical protein GY697_06445, partial [Desulfobacterales bacterium]|nr:hypothetical protein [Desulfobacterales bacterium]